MSLRDEPRFRESESLRRERPAEFSLEAITEQVNAFFAKGGRIQEIPAGVTALAPVAFRNSATRRANDISYSEKDRAK